MPAPPRRRPGPRIAYAPRGTPRWPRQPRTGRALAVNRPARLRAVQARAVPPLRTPVLVARPRPPEPPQQEAQPLARLPTHWRGGPCLAQYLQPPRGPWARKPPRVALVLRRNPRPRPPCQRSRPSPARQEAARARAQQVHVRGDREAGRSPTTKSRLAAAQPAVPGRQRSGTPHRWVLPVSAPPPAHCHCVRSHPPGRRPLRNSSPSLSFQLPQR
jgi:hypothetical protein